MASHFSFLMVSLHSDSSSSSLVVAVQTPHVNGHFFFPFSVSHLPLAFLASHFSLLMVSLHSESSSPSLVVAVQTPHVNGHFFFPFSVSSSLWLSWLRIFLC